MLLRRVRVRDGPGRLRDTLGRTGSKTMSSLVLLAALGPLSLAFQSTRNPLAHRTAPLMSSAAATVEESDNKSSLFQPAGG